MSALPEWIVVSKAVEKACAGESRKYKKGAVVLETAGTFMGLKELGLKTARGIAKKLADMSVAPVYTAVIDGVLKIGLSDKELEFLAHEPKLLKAGARDLCTVIAKKQNAVTSLSAAIVAAEYAGIPVVSGGGLGGVHRGAEISMDISPDLEILATYPVITVCSGPKSILDIGLTLEYLETRSVPVIGYGTDQMPAYLCRDSGFKTSGKADTPEEAAELFEIKEKLLQWTGMLLVNPIAEKHAVDSALMKDAVDKALAAAEKDGIKGKAVTEYLMKKVKESLGADSAKALAKMQTDNAVLAGKVSDAIVRLRARGSFGHLFDDEMFDDPDFYGPADDE